jgi:hypothetical protein
MNNISWENAILEAVKEFGGTATLKELYQKVPQIRNIPSHLDAKHIIRVFLRRAASHNWWKFLLSISYPYSA